MTLAGLDAACAIAAANADEAETSRRLTPATVDAIRATGLFRAYVPQAYGGPELDPLTVLDAFETVARADGAAGWCAMIAGTTTSVASLLPAQGAVEVFGDAASISGGAYAPSGRAVSCGEGMLRVSGRWMWGSGTDHCDWITGGVVTESGEFRLCFMPAARVVFHDTWYSMGLRGTASGDFEVDGVDVPEYRSFRPGAGPRYTDAPIARFPMFNVLASGVASVCLGIAQHAVDEILGQATGKVPLFSTKSLAEQQYGQHDVAKAQACVSAARAFLHDEIGRAWALVQRGDRPSVEQRARIRLACTHAAEESIRAVDLAYHLGGGSAVFMSNPLQRCFRDIHTASQHLMVSGRILSTVGRVLLGLDTDTSTL
jgi:alkylation response protein AidB-like acyl-CoA dehydrogenase